MKGIAPTIGGDRPGCGLRVRLDHPKALAAADFNCPCGDFAEDATGEHEVQQLVIRAARHMRDDCTNTEVRAAAGLQYARLQHSLTRRQNRK